MDITLDRDINNSEDELLKILLKNPYINKINDEVTAKSLASWLIKESTFRLERRVKQRDVFGLITKLSINGVFYQRKVRQTILLQPTSLYFAVKKGKPFCKAPETNIEGPFFDYSNKFQDAGSERITINVEELIEKEFSNSRSICFKDILLTNMNNYNGPNKELIDNSPLFFELLCSILNDKYCDWHTKILISSSLGYFVLEDDVIPDSCENGYVDDLFIICFVLRKIKNNNFSKLIEDNWPYDENILELIEEIYGKSYHIVGNRACEILHKVGLYKFENLELEEYSGTYNDRLYKLANEKRELLGLLAFVIKQLYNVNMNNKSFSKVKEYIMQYGDYDEVNRLIELSKLNHDFQKEKDQEKDFSYRLEEELKKARLNALLDE